VKAIIARESGLYTLINVTDVDPARQTELVARYSEVTEQVMSHANGFVSASLHRSVDGERVVNYVQWRSEDNFAEARHRPDFLALVTDVSSIASPDPRAYEIVSVVGAATE
jgi:quinol monooxygenase YgiN